MRNSYFKRDSGVFSCRHCGRRTRDTNGCNGSVRLCEDCDEGCMQENGYLNSEGEEQAQYKRDMDACFQRAVDKGGRIKGYTPTA